MTTPTGHHHTLLQCRPSGGGPVWPRESSTGSAMLVHVQASTASICCCASRRARAGCCRLVVTRRAVRNASACCTTAFRVTAAGRCTVRVGASAQLGDGRGALEAGQAGPMADIFEEHVPLFVERHAAGGLTVAERGGTDSRSVAGYSVLSNDSCSNSPRLVDGPRRRGTAHLVRPARAGRPIGLRRRPLQTPAVDPVVLGHHRTAQGDRAEPRGHRRRVAQGARSGRRPSRRRPLLLPHLDQLDVLEPHGRGPDARLDDRPLRRQSHPARRQRGLEGRRADSRECGRCGSGLSDLGREGRRASGGRARAERAA